MKRGGAKAVKHKHCKVSTLQCSNKCRHIESEDHQVLSLHIKGYEAPDMLRVPFC